MHRHPTLARLCLAFILISICSTAIFSGSAPAKEQLNHQYVTSMEQLALRNTNNATEQTGAQEIAAND